MTELPELVDYDTDDFDVRCQHHYPGIHTQCTSDADYKFTYVNYDATVYTCEEHGTLPSDAS